MVILNWDDVYMTLHDGTSDEIIKLRCPDCGDVIRYEYERFDNESASFVIRCDNCGVRLNGYLPHGSDKPLCVEYFGNEAAITENMKELQMV